LSINSPRQLQQLANVLKEAIVKEGLYTEINKKNYVNVEGWEFAGAITGIVPIVTMVIDLSTDSEIKYRAEVELRNIHSDMVVGCGIAICSNKEKTKKFFEEYAIASMAQTRAIGKAYRNIFAWLMKTAGYEATPAEEMDDIEDKGKKDKDNSKASEDQINAVNVMARVKGVEVDVKNMTSEQAKVKIIELSKLPKKEV
jgi:hypothetical protein